MRLQNSLTLCALAQTAVAFRRSRNEFWGPGMFLRKDRVGSGLAKTHHQVIPVQAPVLRSRREVEGLAGVWFVGAEEREAGAGESKSRRSFVAGWGGRDRTCAWRDQNPLPYRLATPQTTKPKSLCGLCENCKNFIDSGNFHTQAVASTLRAARWRGVSRELVWESAHPLTHGKSLVRAGFVLGLYRAPPSDTAPS